MDVPVVRLEWLSRLLRRRGICWVGGIIRGHDYRVIIVHLELV
jgi:hypothetical protein